MSRRMVETHAEVRGVPVESVRRIGTAGEVTTAYVVIGNSAYSEADARELLKGLGEAIQAAWPRLGGE